MKSMMHSGTACLAMLTLASTVAYASELESNSDSAKPDKQPTQLSVAPLDHRTYPDSRPTWTYNEGLDLESSPHKLVLVSQPCDTQEECEENLQLSQRAAVAIYIKDLAKADNFDFFEVNDVWIEERLVTRDYTGTLKEGDTEMREAAVELTFTPEVQSEIKTAWDKYLVGDRLAAMSFIVFVGLMLMVCVSMFLSTFSRRVALAETEPLQL